MTSTIASINKYSSVTVNPLASPEQIYELYSVPSFDTQYPEIITGKDIGSTKVEIQENDVLICKINPRINRVWIVKHNTEYPLIASSEWIVVRSPENDPSYLKWYFSSEQFKRLMVSQVTGIGGSLTRAQPKQVATYPVPLPDLPTQRRIAATLDKVSEGIAVCRQMLADLDVMVKARFVEMFADPEINPMGWDKRPLSQIIEYANNGMARRGNDDDGNIVLRLVELQDGYFDYSNPNRIVLSEGEKKRYLLKESDFLFARVNGNPDNVGRCAVFHDIGEDVYHNDHIIRVHFNESLLDGVFASALFNSDYGKRQLRNQIKTSAGQYTVSQDGIGAIIAILPPITKQQQFADIVAHTDKSKSVVQQQLAELETLKKSLMQEYFG